MKLVSATLESMVIDRPEPTEQRPQHICLDKRYDYREIRELAAQWGYTPHIRSRGEEERERAEIPGYRARRWVVERTHSWLNRFRRLLIRWEKDQDNYLGMLHLNQSQVGMRICLTPRIGSGVSLEGLGP